KNCLPYFTFSGTFTNRISDGLKKHSGLIVLDFDDLDGTSLSILQDNLPDIAWVCAYWISPSGNGLKVLVKIDPAHHLASFQMLSQFFAESFSLEVDPSGKDIARACFVSSDPNLYYNPDSAELVLQNAPQEEKKEPSIVNSPTPVNDFEAQRKVAKDLARVAYVVEQIEREQIDITSEYSDWQLVAFALAVLGEEGRSYFHRVSKIHGEYNEADADAKFDDAIAKGRFKTAAKFFSMAKDHGLNIKMPVTLQEAQKAAEAKEVIGDEDSADDYVKYGIYLKKSTQTYWSLDMKGIPREISNFKLRILYHINTGADEAYRLMEIKNIYGLEKVLRINTDDFVSAGSFKKVIARLGNFIWKGQDHDLVRLQDMLQRHERHTEMVGT